MKCLGRARIDQAALVVVFAVRSGNGTLQVGNPDFISKKKYTACFGAKALLEGPISLVRARRHQMLLQNWA